MLLMSPGVSVIAAAGLVSGLCFIVINGLLKGRANQDKDKEDKENQDRDNSRCACCLKPFSIGRGVECSECGFRVCRKGCSRWATPEDAWHCIFCHQRRLWLRRNEKWFETFGGLSADHDDATHRFSTAKSQVYLAGADYAGVAPGVGLAAGGEEDAGDSLERVRNFVEKIVEGLVGDVDEILIDRLYDHLAYDQLIENYKQPLAGVLARLAISLQLSISNKPVADTPTMAHAALRDLVERAVEEAKKLPGLGSSDAGRSTEQRDISDQTYEDLLATAILNKVIEKYQNERVEGDEKKSSPRQNYITSEVEVGLDEGVEEGSSSLEPLSQDEYSSDCSAPAQKYSTTRQEPLSLTIEEHIEEVTTTYTSDEEERENRDTGELDFRNARRVPFPEFGMDIIDPSQESSDDTQDEALTPTHVDLVTPLESWEENWLFQKRKMQAQSEPVSMLVPNPSEDLKPRIGDQEADDTSDLSDCSAQSDDEIEEELFEAINNVVPRTPEADETSPSLLNIKDAQNAMNSTKIGDTEAKIEPEGSASDDGPTSVEKSEQSLANGSLESTNIKIGIGETLVFHLTAENSRTKVKNENHPRGSSTEFILQEKSSIENSSFETEDKKELGNSKQSVELAKEEVNLQTQSLDVENLPDSLEDQTTQKSKIILRDFGVDEKDREELLNFDDSDAPELPRTPMPSPFELETSATNTQIQTDLRSLDEKLVSIETRSDINPDSLEETFNEHVSVNPEGGVAMVKAQFVFVENEDEHPETERIEPQHGGTGQQNEDGAQQESEYTEHYDTAIQRHLDSLTRPAKRVNQAEIIGDDVPPPIPSIPPPIARLRQGRDAAILDGVDVVDKPRAAERKQVQDVESFLATPPRPGTIAEREHKKWENAAPIENNPYSEENIQKRLWQRQYSRKVSSDTSGGVSPEVLKTEGNSIQVVLGAGQPDVKRYGRDYYINEAKKASGERERRLAMANAGRPNSSLSQYSGSFDDDLEPQEAKKIQYQEPEPVVNTVSEVETKITTWQQNNIESNNSKVVPRGRQRVEATIHLEVSPDKVDGINETLKGSISEVQEISWDGKTADAAELLENVRRNSKNELNAKLNNQEDGSESRKSFLKEKQKSIHRIDLRAYGFENEIKTNGSTATKRVVNKLDLRSFGYGSDLQRIQSTGQIDEKLNNEVIPKPRIVKMETKLNLSDYHAYRERSKSSQNIVNSVEYEVTSSGDFVTTKSTEILNEDKKKNLSVFDEFPGITSAKSMPNVARIEQYSQKLIDTRGSGDEEDSKVNVNFGSKSEKFREEERWRREMIKASSKSQGLWKSEITILDGERTGSIGFSSDDELDDVIIKSRSTEVLSKKELFEKVSEKNTTTVTSSVNEDLPMPSVRRLAQAFIKTPVEKPTAPPRVLKTYSTVRKERPTTPEIHIIETPRQMHSLTARSLSREFREGLRQIPNKVSSPPASQLSADQATNIQNDSKLVSSSEVDSFTDDIAVIAPGKLKNNIKFWEQLQKQS